jgi:hypothetical protein
VPWNADGMNSQPVPTSDLFVDGSLLRVKVRIIGRIDGVIATRADMQNYSCPWATRLLKFPSRQYHQDKIEIFWRTCIRNMSGSQHDDSWTAASGDHFRCYTIMCTSQGFKGSKAAENSKEFDAYLAAHPLKRLALGDDSNLVPYMPNRIEFSKAILNRPEAGSYQTVGNFKAAAIGIMQSRGTEFYQAMTTAMLDHVVVSTFQGHLANILVWSKKNDRIVILKGSPCQLVLRPDSLLHRR